MLILLLVIWNAFQSLSSFPDSIQNLITKTEDDSVKAVLFYDLGKHFYGIDQDTAIYFAQNAIQLAEKLGLDKVKGNALNIMGVALLIRSDYEDALKTHLQALKIRETLKDSTGMLESNLNIGNVYYRNGEMGKAAEMYEKALVYGLATKNLRGQSLIYNNLGNYYSDRWVANQSQEDYNLALEYLQKSLQIKEELKDNRGLVNTLTQLSSLSKNDRGKASGYLLRALNIAEANQDIENKINVLNELSNYFLQGKDYAKVREYALKSYQLAKDANSHFYISRSADFLIEAAKGQNDFKSAYEYLVIKKTADEALFNDNRAKIREELLIEYETEKKELENQRLMQEQQLLDLSLQRRNELLVGIALVLIVLGFLVWFQKKNHEKLKDAHLQLEKAHALTQEQNRKIQTQADHLNEINQALTKANQFRDKIFSVISHDLRAPFSSLHSIIQLWDKKMLTEEELQEVMPMIAKDTHSLSLMLNNLLIWSREQMGVEEVQKSTFNLEDLVNESVELLNSQITHKKLDFSHDSTNGLEVTTDRERLGFIVRNILMNAIKFTPEGGKVTVDYPNRNEIRIKDSGRGMPPEMVSKLFTDRIISEKGTEGESGTGIGLMLCKEFADSLGAEIHVESEVGVGTTFRVVIQTDL
ncbi:tetratricopeptide repeat-containing sensor histidine kinase [Algoriphagus boritolerans]|uniref:histidine kinase n=1 Tax=Algoriphagus boritolerans DSM 17298 = JCM 18970 TaxID=1120964 RepID=A0A1H5RZL2_9BACT|nr:tetratricopeptide repeat-containing sensor histidine kinase [Algoriphagus boritolerans]SEF43803.1 Signal transduction histidine kinase [Algoriphagus boritolerans DSM 17298 = JCM 18970]